MNGHRLKSATFFAPDEVQQKRDNSNIATGMKYGTASSSSRSNSICNLQTGIARIRAPFERPHGFKGEQLERTRTSRPAPASSRRVPKFPHTWLIENFQSPGYPIMDTVRWHYAQLEKGALSRP